ncbi:prolyl oligopeptidase [Piscinibacter gummiphilus]|uniref:Prolyl oligopeptidase n=2 Tax=Piscinibacter gummiphilus TaxID=946333 RepID=A0A1W6LC58_9BURK|nr:prolyl oligopeptidase [Piscinibacter gummiphilus]GLS93898.1 prolyl oligopeptidase [Piscinibacter gummiphilus]
MPVPFVRRAFGLLAGALVLSACTHMTTSPAAPTPTAPDADPLLWLEDVSGDAALDWVRGQNQLSQAELTARPEYAPTRAQLLEVLNARDRIPYVVRRGPWLYNLWQDDVHKRGLWRRTTLAQYKLAAPDWETVLDLDALATSENENWVWGGAACLGPDYRRCLILLSRGGADAKVIREFDAVEKRFVDGGFFLPEAKSDVDWIDEDTLYVGTDFGPGSLTDSGYPRVIKRWRRGTPLADAVTVFEGEARDVAVGVSVDKTPGHERTLFSRATDFYNQKYFLLDGDRLVPLDIPSDASPSFLRDTMLLGLRSEFQGFPSGALLHTDAAAYLRGERRLQAMFTPSATRSLSGYAFTRDHVVLNVMDNVASRLELFRKDGATFTGRPIEAPFPGSLGVSPLHDPLLPSDDLAESYLLTYTDFLTPDSLYLGSTRDDRREPLKSRTALFDSGGQRVEQRFATSRDGTHVPYFVVWPEGAQADGTNPTLLYGYGGFEISLKPWYSGGFGRAWYRRGGVLVVANIRGGGEFGPAWHQAAVKEHKQRSYDDFIAVAEDLVETGVTSPAQLGIMGGSNGGLLVGATFVQRPDLFNAVVCQVPLLDMRRYHTLLAGASWMAEYGNPDVEAEWSFISKYSPYQNVKAGVTYPKVLFTTSTRDDRVHPAHARKMAARMMAQGHPVLYYENIEGGHGGAADNEQRAHLQALEFSYLWQQLGRRVSEK